MKRLLLALCLLLVGGSARALYMVYQGKPPQPTITAVAFYATCGSGSAYTAGNPAPVLDTASSGTQISQVCVTMSDNSAFTGSLSITSQSATGMVQLSGANVQVASVSSANDGSQTAVIQATPGTGEGGSTSSATLNMNVAASVVNVASIDPTNQDPKDNNLHAAAVANAEVSRFYITKTPFYPTASAATWTLSLSGTAVGHFSLASTSTIPAQLLTDGTAGTYTSPGTLAVVADSGQSFSYTLPTIVVHSGTLATCGSGTTISSAITTAGASGVVLLGICSYTGQSFNPLAGQRLQGSGVGNSVVDGTSVTTELFNNNTANVTLDSLEILGYQSSATCNTGQPAFEFSNDGAVLENSRIHNTHCTGTQQNGMGASILNNRFDDNGLIGLFVYFQGTSGTGAVTVKGNEFDHNNTGNYSSGNAASGFKTFPANNTDLADQSILNNYAHDNNGVQGLWVDTVHDTTHHVFVQGNTVIGNGLNGIKWEASCNGDISHNVVLNNGLGPIYSISPPQASGIDLSQNGPVNVYSNVVGTATTLGSGNPGEGSILFTYDSTRTSDTCSQGSNINVYGNNITYFDSGTTLLAYGIRVWEGTTTGTMCSGLTSCNSGAGAINAFHDTTKTSSASRWMNNTSGPTLSFSQWKTNTSNDTSSTYDAANGTTGITGCLHIACTGAGL